MRRHSAVSGGQNKVCGDGRAVRVTAFTVHEHDPTVEHAEVAASRVLVSEQHAKEPRPDRVLRIAQHTRSRSSIDEHVEGLPVDRPVPDGELDRASLQRPTHGLRACVPLLSYTEAPRGHDQESCKAPQRNFRRHAKL